MTTDPTATRAAAPGRRTPSGGHGSAEWSDLPTPTYRTVTLTMKGWRAVLAAELEPLWERIAEHERRGAEA